MILRSSLTRSNPSTLTNYLARPCIRCFHARTSNSPPIPQPTPFVPDPSTFLTLIGRDLSQHAAKISTWKSLFSLTSHQFRDLGIEPARSRRYLLWWRDRFRKGLYGVGGDLKHVKDGAAELRVVEVAAPEAGTPKESSSGTGTGLMKVKKMIVNEPAEAVEKGLQLGDLKAVEGMKVVGARTIVGPFVEHVKGTRGSVATIKVQAGMWEVRQGIKVDGGERRKVQVRRANLLAERKKSKK